MVGLLAEGAYEPNPEYHNIPVALVCVAVREVEGLFAQTILSTPALMVGAGVTVSVMVLTTGVQLLPEEVRERITDPLAISAALGL